jgi:hypothetical protein
LKREGVVTVPYQSVEAWTIKVKAPVDVRTLIGEVGLSVTGEEDPEEWLPMEWTGQVLSDRYYGAVVIGPLEQGVRYNVYARVTGAGQAPVMHAGVIEAY